MRIFGSTGLLVVAMIAACAPLAGTQAPGVPLTDRSGLSPHERRLLADHPEADYLRGVCYGAANPTAAQAEAKADVARQIDANVTSEIRVSSSSHNGQDFEDILSRVAETAHFERAELIEVLRDSVTCAAGGPSAGPGAGCRALAVLSRDRAVADLSPKAETASRELAVAVDAALAAQNDLPRFTAAFREAERLFLAATPLRHQIATIGRRPIPAGTATDDTRFARLLEARVGVLSAQRVVVDTRDVTPADLGQALGTAVAGALTDLGLSATTGQGCPGTLRVRLTGTAACAYRFVAHQCDLQAEGVLEACPSGRELGRANLAHPSFQGEHQRDVNAARAALAKSLGRGEVAAKLREGWANAVPVR